MKNKETIEDDQIVIDGIDNKTRALWADAATIAYEKIRGVNYEDAEEMIIDLLTDLHHRWPMIDIIKASISAKTHYEAEKE